MSRMVVFMLVVLAASLNLNCLAYAAPPASAPVARELVFLTWTDYMDPALIEAFEQQFNARVRFAYYADDPARDRMMIESEGHGYDVILVTGLEIDVYRKRGWLAPLDETLIPNLEHIGERWRNAYTAASAYSVPYAWGTLGIAYRSDLVGGEINHWRQLLEPGKDLRGKITMIKDYRDILAVALKALNYSVNSTDLQELDAAAELLWTQKPYVKTYSYMSLTEASELVTGEVLAALMYNGDALMLQEYQPAIEFVIPAEGSALWVDYLTVAASSERKELALQFINFLNDPKNAAQLAEYTYMATPNKSAEHLLPAAFLHNPLIYPSPDVLAKSEFYTSLPPRVLHARNRIIAQILR